MSQNAQVLRLEPRSTRQTLWDLSAVRLRMDGMGCTHCEERIRQGLLASPGVRAARVELGSYVNAANDTAYVDIDPSRCDPEDVRRSLATAGYLPPQAV